MRTGIDGFVRIGVDSIHETSNFTVEMSVRLEFIRELLARHEGWVFKVKLSVRPLLPGFARVDNEVASQPGSLLSALFIEEPLVFNFGHIGVHQFEEQVDIEVVKALASVEFDVFGLNAFIEEAQRGLVVHFGNCKINWS